MDAKKSVVDVTEENEIYIHRGGVEEADGARRTQRETDLLEGQDVKLSRSLILMSKAYITNTGVR